MKSDLENLVDEDMRMSGFDPGVRDDVEEFWNDYLNSDFDVILISKIIDRI